MKKFRIAILIVLSLVLLAGLVFFGLDYINPKGAGLYIETEPTAAVYIDSEQVGRTPYRETREPQEVIVKLVPESFDTPLVPYETKITLTPGVETVIRRQFGQTEETSSGEIISFEKAEKDETSLAVVSIPDSAQVYTDGDISGFAPHKTSAILPGEHTIKLTASGYQDKSLVINTHEGYKLTAVVKLAISNEKTQIDEPQEEPKEEEKKVTIENTPTGFLRVREEPSTLATELGQVEPGEEYLLVSTDEDTGWFEIRFTEEETGWISNNYARLKDANEKEATSSADSQ